MHTIKKVFFITSLFFIAGCSTPPQTYYLDATNGNDTNSGLSADNAWKTLERIKKTSLQKGDKILLKRGEVFNGILDITGKGTYTHPIIIDAYGEGNQKPCIAGNDTSMYAVRIFNSDYFTIQNLEISNTGKERKAGRTGLKVECTNYGISHNIRINNLTIRDVNGSLVKEEGGGSGILIVNGGDSIRSRFDSLTIENCHILRCERNAMIWSGYYDRKNWYPNKHTIVRNNVIEKYLVTALSP